jgi:hypothetical protein
VPGIRETGKPLALIGVAACLAFAAAGCGSSSSDTSTTEAESGGPGGAKLPSGLPSSASPDDKSSPSGPSSNDSSSDDSNGGGSSGGSGQSSSGSGGGERNANGAPLGSDTKKNGDNSIETYGTEVEGPEKEAVVAAMRSFVTAVAERDYAKVCAGLSTRIREGLAQSDKRCPELLESLLIIPPSEARASANGTVTQVRVGGDNAFVLFRPAGSSLLNYFVMSLEGGEWKSLGLTIGTPLNAAAATE